MASFNILHICCQLGGTWGIPVHGEHVHPGGGGVPQHRGHGLLVLRLKLPVHPDCRTCECLFSLDVSSALCGALCELNPLLSTSRSSLCRPSPCSRRWAAEVAGWCWHTKLWTCIRPAWTLAYAPWWWTEECKWQRWTFEPLLVYKCDRHLPSAPRFYMQQVLVQNGPFRCVCTPGHRSVIMQQWMKILLSYNSIQQFTTKYWTWIISQPSECFVSSK